MCRRRKQQQRMSKAAAAHAIEHACASILWSHEYQWGPASMVLHRQDMAWASRRGVQHCALCWQCRQRAAQILGKPLLTAIWPKRTMSKQALTEDITCVLPASQQRPSRVTSEAFLACRSKSCSGSLHRLRRCWLHRCNFTLRPSA